MINLVPGIFFFQVHYNNLYFIIFSKNNRMNFISGIIHFIKRVEVDK